MVASPPRRTGPEPSFSDGEFIQAAKQANSAAFVAHVRWATVGAGRCGTLARSRECLLAGPPRACCPFPGKCADLTGDDTESYLAVRLRALETRVSASPAVAGAVLNLSAPDEPMLAV